MGFWEEANAARENKIKNDNERDTMAYAFIESDLSNVEQEIYEALRSRAIRTYQSTGAIRGHLLSYDWDAQKWQECNTDIIKNHIRSCAMAALNRLSTETGHLSHNQYDYARVSDGENSALTLTIHANLTPR